MKILPFDKYDLTTYTLPIDKTKIIYNETVLFVGNDDSACLLFSPKKIISVRSYDLKKEYVNGVDYYIEGDKIRLTKDTTIPYFKKEEYYLQNEIPGKCFECSAPNKPYIYFGEGDTFTKMQIAVTYVANKKPIFNKIKSFKNNFKNTIKSLKNKKKLKVLFYGDSITVGANSSKFINVPPYAETYPEMITSYLREKYKTEIEYVNTAKGGMTTEWGINNVNELVIRHNPDLVFIAFGMNNGNFTPNEYADKIQEIITPIKSSNKNIEIMLIPPMLPNMEVKPVAGKQEFYEDGLKILNKKYGYAYSPVTSIHKKILKRKRYYDMTGNNVNHPNDFLARIYVQTILKSMLGKDYKKL